MAISMGASSFGHARLYNVVGNVNKGGVYQGNLTASSHTHILADFDVNIGLSHSISHNTASLWNDMRGVTGFASQLSSSGNTIIYDSGSNQITNLGNGNFHSVATQGGSWNPINPLSLCLFGIYPSITESYYASVCDSISANSYIALYTNAAANPNPTLGGIGGFSDTFCRTNIQPQTYLNKYRTTIACVGTGSLAVTSSIVAAGPNIAPTVTTLIQNNQSLSSALTLFNIWPGGGSSQGNLNNAITSIRGAIVLDHVITTGEALYLGMFGAARYGCIHL